MYNSRLRGAAYRAYVRDRVGEYMKTVCPAFTLKEIAKFAKLSVTPSLRKRLLEMKKDGLLHMEKVYVGQRGTHFICYKTGEIRMYLS